MDGVNYYQLSIALQKYINSQTRPLWGQQARKQLAGYRQAFYRMLLLYLYYCNTKSEMPIKKIIAILWSLNGPILVDISGVSCFYRPEGFLSILGLGLLFVSTCNGSRGQFWDVPKYIYCSTLVF